MKNHTKFKKRFLKKHHLGEFEYQCFTINIMSSLPHNVEDKLWDDIIELVDDYNCWCYGSTITGDKFKMPNDLYQNFIDYFEILNEKYDCKIEISPIYDINYFEYDFKTKKLIQANYVKSYEKRIYDEYVKYKGEIK